MRSNSLLVLVGFFAAVFAAAALGGVVTSTSVGNWFLTLNKPSWNPPSWLFGPVWSVLYTMMAVAAWRVWRLANSPARTTTLWLFFIQLGLNTAWSCLFFGLRRPDLALIDIVILLGLLITVQISLSKLDRIASWLWAPYLVWVSFASALNTSIWWLNR